MGITRLKYKRSKNGWWVRHKYVDGSPTFQQTFYDHAYHDEHKSYDAAKKYCTYLEKTYPLNPKGNRRTPDSVIRVAYQPMEGVTRNVHKNGDYWAASVSLQKYKQTSKTFSVNKYGERESERLAIMARILLLQTHPVEACRPVFNSFR